jgi:NAD(P)-dependent dehydrogenase (short-subunit alcohol dehydrogenase family)
MALVTAASRNLGAATAAALAERGADVAINYYDDPDDAATTVVADLESRGVRCVAVPGNLDAPGGMQSVIAQAREALGGGPITVLINNYGPFSMTPFADMPEEEFDRIWNANVRNAYLAVRELLPEMRRAGWGRIVNLSAGSAFLRNHSIYSLAKAALMTLTESLALEVGPDIRVNAIAPGQIAESAEDMAAEDPSFMERIVDHTPIGRLVTRPEVAAMIAEMCGPRFDAVNGVTLPMDGGARIARF